MQHKGWTYENDGENCHDRSMADHCAVKNGKRKSIDHSFYSGMSEAAFRAHIDLGFPPRTGVGPWNNETIVAAAIKENSNG